MCSLRQNGQYVSDGPFLIAAVLNGELEGELRLFALHQLQTTLRINVLDGATLRVIWKERHRKRGVGGGGKLDLGYTINNTP